MSVAPTNATPEEAEAYSRGIAMNRDIELINCAAGYKAEAHYRRVSSFACALSGGTGDLDRSREILATWYPAEADRTGAARTADQRASSTTRISNCISQPHQRK